MSDTLRLKPGSHRILEGAPWAYRGELFHSNIAPGRVLTLEESNGRFVGQGFFNPASLIAFRLLTRNIHHRIDGAWFQERLTKAANMRRQLIPNREAYRVVNSEADEIPGLIVDKYGSMLVMEILSLGLESFRSTIIEGLVEIYHPQGIYERGDLAVRTKEGLSREDRLVYGDMAKSITIKENGVSLAIDIAGGQKTGHFLDQFDNRRRAAELSAGKDVFDAFCHTGAFALQCARHGANHVVGIDINPDALLRAKENAAENGLSSQVDFIEANAFDWLRTESEQGAHYDLGILDPPAFTKSKESVAGALRGYKEINLRGIKLIRPGGILLTSSCSYHVSEEQFIEVLRDAAKDAKRGLRILEIRGQGLDHPVLPGLPESRYLKFLVCYVS